MQFFWVKPPNKWLHMGKLLCTWNFYLWSFIISLFHGKLAGEYPILSIHFFFCENFSALGISIIGLLLFLYFTGNLQVSTTQSFSFHFFSIYKKRQCINNASLVCSNGTVATVVFFFFFFSVARLYFFFF